MTLDERILIELTELCNGGDNQGEIKAAVAINGLIQTKPGQTRLPPRLCLVITQVTARSKLSW